MTYGIADTDKTMVVCPSISFPAVELRKITGIEHYEERLLFTLLELRDPDVRIVYLTSMPVDQAIIDYYLSFVPDAGDARTRLELISIDDPEPRALSAKLLESPDVIAHVRSLVGGERSAFMLPFNVTSWEASLSRAVGVRLYGPPPDLVGLGSKSGARHLARAAGIAVPEGAEDLWSLEEVERAVDELRRRPGLDAVVIKLNDGFSGQGNAIVSLDAPTSPLERAPTVFCAAGESWASFRAKIASGGAVVEELVRGSTTLSPSAQVWIRPGGGVELLSTHDQILGGPDDQVYLGCRFPARPDYRAAIAERALRLGEVLAARGVIGPFGADFLVVQDRVRRDILLSEINLRMGGTTHPFAMARLATNGVYDGVTGELRVDGRAKYYVATDNLRSPTYVGLHAADVIEQLRRSGAAFDPARATGVMLHLLGALPRFGKMGMTCIGDSIEESDALYSDAVAALDSLARR